MQNKSLRHYFASGGTIVISVKTYKRATAFTSITPEWELVQPHLSPASTQDDPWMCCTVIDRVTSLKVTTVPPTLMSKLIGDGPTCPQRDCIWLDSSWGDVGDTVTALNDWKLEFHIQIPKSLLVWTCHNMSSAWYLPFNDFARLILCATLAVSWTETKKKARKKDLRLKKNYSFDSRAQVVSGENRGFWSWRYISSLWEAVLIRCGPLWFPPPSKQLLKRGAEHHKLYSSESLRQFTILCHFDTNTHSRTSTILFSISVVTARLLLIPHTEACQITARRLACSRNKLFWADVHANKLKTLW